MHDLGSEIFIIEIVSDPKLAAAVNWFMVETDLPEKKVENAIKKSINEVMVRNKVGMSWKNMHIVIEHIARKLGWEYDKYIRAGAYLKLIKVNVLINSGKVQKSIFSIMD